MTAVPELPPRPDPQSGAPRPPRAPTEGAESNEKKQLLHPRRVLSGPTDAGPVLEWDYVDGRTQRWVFGILLVLLLVLATLKYGGFEWVSVWWLWIALPGLAFLASLFARGHKLSAGADWLNCRGGTVYTYQLTKVEMTSHAGGYGLELADDHGGTASADVALIQVNEDLWDLVYNGILHSVAGGAEVNRLAVERLRLADALKRRERASG